MKYFNIYEGRGGCEAGHQRDYRVKIVLKSVVQSCDRRVCVQNQELKY